MGLCHLGNLKLTLLEFIGGNNERKLSPNLGKVYIIH